LILIKFWDIKFNQKLLPEGAADIQTDTASSNPIALPYYISFSTGIRLFILSSRKFISFTSFLGCLMILV
jgi:hypothetical protein